VVVDPNTNLPQEHPYVITTNEIERIFGGRNLVIVGVEAAAGDIFQPAVLAKIHRITDGILEIPGVIRSNVISLAARKAKDIVGTEDGMLVRPLVEALPQTPSDLPRLRQAVHANPIYLDSIVSKDGRMALIIGDFKFNRELPGYRPIKERVEAVIDRERDAGVNLYLGGISIKLAWLEIYLQRTQYLFFAALLIVLGVLYLSFRSLQRMLVPVATALMSVVWGLGLMGLMDVPIDTFNATTPILIMAVAAGHSVQVLKRFYEEYRVLHDSPAAVIASLSKVGPVMLTAGSIAVVSFLSLTAFPILTIQVFGVFTAMGILSAMILELTFIPAVRSFIAAPRRDETDQGRAGDWLDRFMQGVAGVIAARPWPVILGTWGGIVLVLLAGMHRLAIDNSLKGNFSPDSAVRRDDVPLNQGMGGTNTLYLLIEGADADAIKNPEALMAMEAVQRHLQERYALVGKTQSLTDLRV
jgi:predicted RND superfamily exporter protein